MGKVITRRSRLCPPALLSRLQRSFSQTPSTNDMANVSLGFLIMRSRLLLPPAHYAPKEQYPLFLHHLLSLILISPLFLKLILRILHTLNSSPGSKLGVRQQQACVMSQIKYPIIITTVILMVYILSTHILDNSSYL